MSYLENFFTKSWLTTLIEREHHQNELNSTVLENQKSIMVTITITKTLLLGPSFSGETYIMLKNLLRKPDRDKNIISKMPPKQYSNSKTKIKETVENIKPLDQNENAILVLMMFQAQQTADT